MASTRRSHDDEILRMRQREEIMMAQAMRPGPAEVVCDVRRFQPIREVAKSRKVGLVERFVTKEIEADAVQHDGLVAAESLEPPSRRFSITEEVVRDHFIIVDRTS